MLFFLSKCVCLFACVSSPLVCVCVLFVRFQSVRPGALGTHSFHTHCHAQEEAIKFTGGELSGGRVVVRSTKKPQQYLLLSPPAPSPSPVAAQCWYADWGKSLRCRSPLMGSTRRLESASEGDSMMEEDEPMGSQHSVDSLTMLSEAAMHEDMAS